MQPEIQTTVVFSPGKKKLEELKKKIAEKKLQKEAAIKFLIKPKPKPKVTVKVLSKQEIMERKIKLLPLVPDDPQQLKMLCPKEETIKALWNKSLPVPLMLGEKVIVLKNQEGVQRGYVRVMHGETGQKTTSVFSLDNFNKVDGEKLFWRHRSKYIKMYMIQYGKIKIKLDPSDSRFRPHHVIQRMLDNTPKIRKRKEELVEE